MSDPTSSVSVPPANNSVLNGAGKHPDPPAPPPTLPASLQPLRPGDRLMAVAIGIGSAILFLGITWWLLGDTMRQ